MADKKKYFEYFLDKLYTMKGEDNDLSILKVLKLLFFTTAVDTEHGGTNILIDDIFTNFSAMPYGHVESDIYDKRDELDNFIVDTKKTERKGIVDHQGLDGHKTRAIDDALRMLGQKNNEIFDESAFSLVELSHQYDSWIMNYNKAKSQGIFSHPIDAEKIKTEDKFYKLNSFEIF